MKKVWLWALSCSACVLTLRADCDCEHKVFLFGDHRSWACIWYICELMWVKMGRATKRGHCKCKCNDIWCIQYVRTLHPPNVVTLHERKVLNSEGWLLCLLFSVLSKGRQQLPLSVILHSVCVCMFISVHTCAIICSKFPGWKSWNLIPGFTHGWDSDLKEVGRLKSKSYIFFFITVS